MKKIFTFIISIVAMVATACSEYQEVVDYEPLVLISSESVDIEGVDDNSFQVSYNALSRVEMSTDCDWIVVPSSFDGDSSGTFTINTIANPSVTERTGKLILTATDPRFAGGMSYSKSITVTQGGGRPTISAYVKSSSHTNSYTTPAAGETVNLYVKASADFKVSNNAGDLLWGEEVWIKFNGKDSYSGKADGDKYVAIEMTFAPNPYEWERTATITIFSEANGAGQYYDIEIKQSKWNIVWRVSKTEIELDYKGKSNYSLTMSSSLSWKATCNADWIELKTAQYTSTDQYTSGYINLSPTIKENMSVIDRSAEIVIQCTKPGYTDRKYTVRIMQTGRPELYFYDTAEYSVSNMAGNYAVKFLSENAWIASTDATWLTISTTSGSGVDYAQYLQFSVQPNTSTERRTATITLAVNGDSRVNATLTVVQGSAGELFYKSSQKLNLTDGLFDVSIAEHTFDEARDEGRVTFNGTMTALTDQEPTSYSVWRGATAVYLPSTVKSIGNAAFRYCDNYDGFTISLPEGLERIGDYAFQLCSTSAFNIPSSVTEIGEGAFSYCDYITEIVIPNGIKAIKSSTFSYCDRLTSVTLPNSVETIGDGAFYYCGKLETITMPSNLREIGSDAFSYCRALQSIEIPAAVGTIGSSAFYYCTALKEITIPEGVKTIGEDTFFDCSSLVRITLPSTLATIGSGAFIACTSLKRVDISDIVNWCKINFGYDHKNNPLYVANAALYLNGSEVTEIDAQTMGIESFSEYCFTGCSSIISLSANRKDVGKHAFGDCPNLKTVRNLSKIGDYAFRNCKNLQTISSLYSADIGKSAFEGCTALTSISHSSSSYSYTVSVGTRAFYGCTNLDTITLPSDGRFANNIGDSAFEGCTSLTKIVVGDKYDEAMSVGNNAFKGCTALNSVEFNYGRQISIYDSAFEGCNNLSRLTIPSSLNYGLFIKSRAFYGCDALAEVNLGSYIQSIGENAFYRIEGKLTITCRASTPPTGAAQMFPIPPTVDLTIKVPTKYVDTYKSATYWKDYADYIVGN
jgi:hypothetical protein